MFTGIIKELAIVTKIVNTTQKVLLKVSTSSVFNTAQVNDSIAINGCCLTITELTNNTASFDILPETLKLTNLGLLTVNQQVNIESSLTLQDKLGGHILQGHVDCTASVLKLEPDGDSTRVYFSLPSKFLKMLVPKGFISINGISLTIVEVTKQYFSVMIIPHTKTITNAKDWQVGTLVNIEVDIMNKSIYYYLQQFNNK